MSKEYDKLLKLVNELNNVSGEKCLICHFPDKLENLVKLKCNHYYHSNCINSSKSESVIKCPYCDKKTKLQENKPSEICQTILTKGINKGKSCNRPNCFYHKKAIIVPTEVIITKQDTCKVLIKTGLKKGTMCNRLDCKYHKVKSIIV